MSNRKALLGKKLGMSQVWDENGFFVPVTLVDVSTNVVTAVKTEESDGYKAVQLGYGAIDPTKVTKPLAGHFAKAGVTPRRHLVEVRTDDVDQFEAGQELAADLFEEGAEVDVTGTTKGKGFAGTIKRWGFKSYRRTHGSHLVNVVTAVKTEESDGYKAVQLGYGAIDPTKVTKPLAGHFAKAGVTPRRHLVEVRTDDVDQFEAGQELAADLFEEGAEVDVTGTTKGKGFAGTIKRWGFKSYRRTHGSHKNERRPGSVGACATPSRILKGKRMAGRMGHVTATTQNLTVVSADVENGILAIKGAIPGPKGGIVLVRSAVKGA